METKSNNVFALGRYGEEKRSSQLESISRQLAAAGFRQAGCA